jgi:hypothetical protein
MSGIWRLRAAVLLLVGSLAVHHGRFLFATPEHEHGLAAVHRYLPYAGALAGCLAFLLVAQLVVWLGRSTSGGEVPALPRAGTLWLACTTCLLTVFAGQESVETLLAHGHLPTLVELLGAGGWAAVPLSLAAGGLVALLLRGAAAVVAWAVSRPAHRPRRALPVAQRAPRVVLAPAGSVLARRLAGRGPPSAA